MMYLPYVSKAALPFCLIVLFTFNLSACGSGGSSKAQGNAPTSPIDSDQQSSRSTNDISSDSNDASSRADASSLSSVVSSSSLAVSSSSAAISSSSLVASSSSVTVSSLSQDTLSETEDFDPSYKPPRFSMFADAKRYEVLRPSFTRNNEDGSSESFDISERLSVAVGGIGSDGNKAKILISLGFGSDENLSPNYIGNNSLAQNNMSAASSVIVADTNIRYQRLFLADTAYQIDGEPIIFDEYKDGDLDVYAPLREKRDGLEYMSHTTLHTNPDNSKRLFPVVKRYFQIPDRALRLSLDIADINGDDEVDVLYSSIDTKAIHWFSVGFYNDLLFIGPKVATPSDGALTFSVSAKDFDADGDTDVIASTSKSIYWYENDGNENFTEHLIDTGEFGRSDTVKPEDINGDGNMDILFISEEAKEIVWYENDGRTVFTKRKVLSDVVCPCNVNSVDIDGDDDRDLVVLSQTALWVFENVENGHFFESHKYDLNNAGHTVKTMAVHDVDEDGVMELVTAARGIFEDSAIVFQYLPAIRFVAFSGNPTVGSVQADSPEGAVLTYNIISGPDAERFKIDAATGEIQFVDVPDGSTPTDNNGDNIYSFFVSASDGITTANHQVRIKLIETNDGTPYLVTDESSE